MEKLNIFFCCGAGMSSGFLAQQMRSCSQESRGLWLRWKLKVKTILQDDLPKTDILLIGPHLAYAYEELKAMCDPYAVPVLIIPKDMYAGLDGKGLLAIMHGNIKGKGGATMNTIY